MVNCIPFSVKEFDYFACLNDGKGEQHVLQPPQQHLAQPKLQVHIIATTMVTL